MFQLFKVPGGDKTYMSTGKRTCPPSGVACGTTIQELLPSGKAVIAYQSVVVDGYVEDDGAFKHTDGNSRVIPVGHVELTLELTA